MSEIEKFEMLHTKVLSFVTKQHLEGENTIESYYKLIEVFEGSTGVDYPNNHNVQVKEQYIDDTIEMVLLRIEIMFKEVDELITYNNKLIFGKLDRAFGDTETPSPESILIKMIEDGKLLEENILLSRISLTNIEDGLIKYVVDFKPTLSTVKKILQLQLDEVTGDTNEPIELLVVIDGNDLNDADLDNYTSFISLYDNYDCQIVLVNNKTNETYISDNVFRIEKLLKALVE